MTSKITSIYVKTPLRISFVGGGTDIKSYYEKNSGAVISCTIDRFVHCYVKKSSSTKFISNDLAIEEIYGEKKNKKLYLHNAVYEYFLKNYKIKKNYYLNIITFSDVKLSSGLGASSSMTVCIILALSKILKIKLTKIQLYKLAYHIERNILGIKGGSQDYLSAIYGGFNYIKFKKNNTFKIYNLKRYNKFINTILSKCYILRVSDRQSKLNIIEDQEKNIKSNKISDFDILLKSTKYAYKSIKQSNYENFFSIINSTWFHKKNTSNLISNNEIDEIIRNILKFSYCCKLSGAGGGGYAFFILNDNLIKPFLIFSSKFDIQKVSFYNNASVINKFEL